MYASFKVNCIPIPRKREKNYKKKVFIIVEGKENKFNGRKEFESCLKGFAQFS